VPSLCLSINTVETEIFIKTRKSPTHQASFPQLFTRPQLPTRLANRLLLFKAFSHWCADCLHNNESRYLRRTPAVLVLDHSCLCSVSRQLELPISHMSALNHQRNQAFDAYQTSSYHTEKPNMSGAVAVSFDPRMEMGIPRSAFTWPGLDNGAELLAHDLHSVGTPPSDPSLTPPLSRSVTSSPPRASMTPEQRELKRQRDQARRDSKTSVRARRAMSSSYSSASQSPPVTMSEFTTASPMPVYTTGPTQISLLSEPATSVAASSYVPSYATSPPLSEHGPSPPLFSAPFSSMPSNDYMHMNYSTGFHTPPTPGMSPHFGRAPSMPEHGMMYPIPPVLSGSNGTAGDAHHVRVVQTRPKPQCWEHGCNGRQFSTFSNLLRHQREKSGQAAKASCPNCGAEFTRTTARNGHLLHDKCKQRRNS
jgi:hypothetical protein